MSGEEKIIFESLYGKYNKLLLSKKECSRELNKSTATLDRERSMAVGVQYIKEGKGDVFYPLTEIARYIVTSQKKTF